MGTHLPLRLAPLALLAATAVVIACESSPTGPPERTFLLVVKPSDATILNGRTLQLNITAQGAKAKALSNVLWSSSDDRIASVGADGKVTARGHGAAQISAWWEGQRAFATVKVLEPPSGPKPVLPPPGNKEKRDKGKLP